MVQVNEFHGYETIDRPVEDTLAFKEWFASKRGVPLCAVRLQADAKLVDLWYGDADGNSFIVTAEGGEWQYWRYDLMDDQDDQEFWAHRRQFGATGMAELHQRIQQRIEVRGRLW